MIRAGLDPETEARREHSVTAAGWSFALLAVMLILGLIVERLV